MTTPRRPSRRAAAATVAAPALRKIPARAARKAPATRARLGARAVDVAAAGVRLLVLDVDGVLTDGRLHYGPGGELTKVFHVRDGHGIRALGRLGVSFAILSGRRSVAVERRARDLGIAHVLQGIDDKLAAFDRLRSRLGLSRAQCACVGDDTPDVPVMRAAGLAFAVADAHDDALAVADVVTRLRGGHGAVREICDRLVAARGL